MKPGSRHSLLSFRFLLPVCCAMAGAQTAADEGRAVEAPNVAILGSHVRTDAVRGVDDGQGFIVTVGWRLSDVTQLQLNTSYINFDTGVPTTDFYRTAAGFDWVRYFNPGGFAPYVVAGLGAAYNDVSVASADGLDFTAGAGLGLLSPPLSDYGLRLRGEARYVHDRFAGKPEDWHFALGLVFPLRKPRSVEVVRVEEREIVKEVIREVPQPERDSDRDGVPDERDACPDTLPGAEVDARGCVREKAVIQLTGVYFEYDSSRLTENSRNILELAAASLRGQASMRVEVAGHTDSRGSDAYNLDLSRRRALAVADFLQASGIAAGRMTPVGYGESQPLDSNDTDGGRERNRRVEFRVIAQ